MDVLCLLAIGALEHTGIARSPGTPGAFISNRNTFFSSPGKNAYALHVSIGHFRSAIALIAWGIKGVFLIYLHQNMA